MDKKQKEFHLGKPCEITDINCWKNEFKAKFNCKQNDLNCWKNKVDNLPCNVGDVECWKKQLPDLPCEQHDRECFRGILPGNLPCELGDKQCWDNVRQKSKEIQFPTVLAQKDPESMEDKVDNEFDRYYSYGFGII